MNTPYGDIPDRFVAGMAPMDMADYLGRRYRRRTVLRGAALLGGLTAAGPVLWRQSDAIAATASTPRWIAYGPSPSSQLWVSWSSGTATGPRHAPSRPQVRYGRDSTYGQTVGASRSGPVPVPSSLRGEPTEHTVYSSALLSGLDPATRYHYSVSNDGRSWSPDATFHTASAKAVDFRFASFGDAGTRPRSTGQLARLVSHLAPAFTLMVGDLAYATALPSPLPHTARFRPAAWDRYLSIVAPAAAQSIPWQAGVGTHEIEPLAQDGYAGFLTRFPQAYAADAGTPVAKSFTYGNVGVIQLDGNDLSVEAPQVTGYTHGKQTRWLRQRLAALRAAGSGIDFIVVTCGPCLYSTNARHSSDGGVRAVWGPLFDEFSVDLVINGHNHCYERTNPMRHGQPTRRVGPGGSVDPAADGTTYICAGGAGQGLYRTFHGQSDSPGSDRGDGTAPTVWRWSGGSTAAGGTGRPEEVTDSAKGFSAFRRAAWHCLVVDVAAPKRRGGSTRLAVRAVAPHQTSSGVSSISNPATMDSVTIVRTSRR